MVLRISRLLLMGKQRHLGSLSLKESDSMLFNLLKEEQTRQCTGLELIASENFTSRAVLECLGSCLTNKYSEGYPGARYYGGNMVMDKIENLARERMLKAFRLSPDEWHVNVQPLSGSPANFAVYTAILKPHERLMGLDLPHGGHLTHGFMSPGFGAKRVSATSVYFESMPYHLDPKTGLIDYEKLQELAESFRPQLIIAGTTAYSRLLDYERFRKICDKVGALLLVDMAHIAGLIAAGVIPSPFEFADVVTSTTHKTLRGPRAGVIFCRKNPRSVLVKGKDVVNPRAVDLAKRIDESVFPSLQGGPHMNAIAAIAAMAEEVNSEDFRRYAAQVLSNAKALADELLNLGYQLISGGTDNHLVLVNLRAKGTDGARTEAVCDLCAITINKNTILGDSSALNPGGARLGSPALTSRGFTEDEMGQVARYFDEAVKISVDAKAQTKMLQEFKKFIVSDPDCCAAIETLKEKVKKLSVQFDTPGLFY